MTAIVSICIAVHNICIIGKDKFNMQWIEEVKKTFKL